MAINQTITKNQYAYAINLLLNIHKNQELHDKKSKEISDKNLILKWVKNKEILISELFFCLKNPSHLGDSFKTNITEIDRKYLIDNKNNIIIYLDNLVTNELNYTRNCLPDELLTTQEIASFLKLSIITINNKIQKGELEAIRINGVWRIPKENLNDFLFKQLSKTNTNSTKQNIKKEPLPNTSLIKNNYTKNTYPQKGHSQEQTHTPINNTKSTVLNEISQNKPSFLNTTETKKVEKEINKEDNFNILKEDKNNVLISPTKNVTTENATDINHTQPQKTETECSLIDSIPEIKVAKKEN